MFIIKRACVGCICTFSEGGCGGMGKNVGGYLRWTGTWPKFCFPVVGRGACANRCSVTLREKSSQISFYRKLLLLHATSEGARWVGAHSQCLGSYEFIYDHLVNSGFLFNDWYKQGKISSKVLSLFLPTTLLYTVRNKFIVIVLLMFARITICLIPGRRDLCIEMSGLFVHWSLQFLQTFEQIADGRA